MNVYSSFFSILRFTSLKRWFDLLIYLDVDFDSNGIYSCRSYHFNSTCIYERKTNGCCTWETEAEDLGEKKLYDETGKLKPLLHETNKNDFKGLSSNVKSIVVISTLMLLMMFAIHVTIRKNSSPSIVLVFYNQQDETRDI